MSERRRESRTPLDASGRIAIDEHRSLPCIVFDRSPHGVRVALPDADGVPDRFLLTIDGAGDGETLVCRAAWRKDDEIGCMTGAPAQAGPARPRRALEPA